MDTVQSYREILADRINVLDELGATKFKDVLRDYRVIRDIGDLDMGKYVRWIRCETKPAKLTAGGIVVDIDETTMRVLCINRTIINVNFYTCAVFQKLAPDELLVANAIEA